MTSPLAVEPPASAGVSVMDRADGLRRWHLAGRFPLDPADWAEAYAADPAAASLAVALDLPRRVGLFLAGPVRPSHIALAVLVTIRALR